AAMEGPEAPGPGDYVVVAVTDTGTGMSDEVRARAFEPFFTTKPLGKGSGLGLPHVLGVTKQLGGGIRINTKPEQGTRIEIYLPRAIEPPKQDATPELAGRDRLNGARLMLVDDDPDVRTATAAMLRDLGCTVIEVGGGAAAVEVIERDESGIDIAMLDFAMPGMNGAEAAQRIRRKRPTLPILLV